MRDIDADSEENQAASRQNEREVFALQMQAKAGQSEPPCNEYDPAGPGAGTEYDGEPQCANCGWPKELHDLRARQVRPEQPQGESLRPDAVTRARALARAIEAHCTGREVPPAIAAICPEHAAMLNGRMKAQDQP